MPSVFGELVDKGVTFTRAYDSASLCCPSRSQIMTGLYESHTWVDGNGVALKRPTVIQAVHDLGYRTSLTGKYLNSWPCDPRPEFDQWVCSGTGLSNYFYVNPTLNVNGTWENFTGYTTDILANYTAEFIESTPVDQSFFAMYTPTSPHLPANDPRCEGMPVVPYRPPSYDEDTLSDGKPTYIQHVPLSQVDEELFDDNYTHMTQAVSCLDPAIGTILSALGDREQNTLVFYLSDNGYLYGEHRRSGKQVPYEEAVRVPFVVRYPALVPENQPFSSSALIMNVDIAPTIADVLGIHWGADGHSLVPLLIGSATSVRDGVLISHCEGASYPCEDDSLAYGKSNVPSLTGVVTEQYAYYEYVIGEKELYDLYADPYQITNVADDSNYQEIQAQLADLLASLRAPPPVDTTIVTGPSGPVDARVMSFTYFSQSRFATYQCRIDTNGAPGTWMPCNGQTTVEGPLPDGDYTFEVEGTDEQGQTDPTPDSRAFSISSTGPRVSIMAGPAPHLKDRTVSIDFSSPAEGVSFQCQNALYGLNDVWTPCISGVSYESLRDGLYLFQVKAVDGIGQESDPPAQWLYRVDNIGPGMSFIVAPSQQTRETSTTLIFQPTEETLGPITCSLDGQPPVDCIDGAFTAVAPSEGTHTVSVTATDTLGNQSTTKQSWTLDLTPAALTVTGTPANGSYTSDTTMSLIALSNELIDPENGLGCALDGGDFDYPQCPLDTPNVATALSDGRHTFEFVALDRAGNASGIVLWEWTVDTVAPTTTITSHPPHRTNQTRARFGFAAGEPSVSFSCAIDGEVPRSCTSKATYRNLTLGTHTFSVFGTDLAGNVGATASWTWVITG